MDTMKSQCDFYVGLTCALICSDPATLSTKKNLLRDCETVKSRSSAEGLSFLTKTLPKLGKALDLGMENGRFNCPREFSKQTRAGSRPKFLRVYFNRIFDDDGVLLECACPDAVRHIRQVCYALYKLEGSYAPDAEQIVIDSFVAGDQALESSYSCDDCDELRLMSHVTETILGDMNPRDVVPRHGPGAVRTGERLEQKWEFSRLYNSIHQFFPYYDYFVVGGGREILDRVHWYRSLERHESGVAKVVLVPKDSRGPRLISMEPLEFQWIQQGLGRKLVEYLEWHPVTRGHINFTQQSINRELALKSSIDGSYATLDLKDASDLVSTGLVEAVFSRTPILLRALLATRSTATELPSGEVVTLKKFAPMGSSLCFPVEAFVFFVIIVAALIRKERYALDEAVRCVYVYGDDIIVKTKHATDAMDALERYGLKVNRSKSFMRGPFRESCGLDAFKGVEVQPIRVKTPWAKKNTDGASYASYCATANLLESRGYSAAVDFLRERVAGLFGPIPFGTKESGYPCIEVPSRSEADAYNYAAGFPHRWSSNYQRHEFLCRRLKTKRRPSVLDGWQRLLRDMVSPAVSDPDVVEIPRSIRIKRGWTPT